MGNVFRKKDKSDTSINNPILVDDVYLNINLEEVEPRPEVDLVDFTKAIADLREESRADKEELKKELKTNKEDSDSKIQKLEKQFQKSEEANRVLVQENKDFKEKLEESNKKIKEHEGKLNKSHESHLESLTYYNEVKANLNQTKEKYIKSSSDQILILTTIVGNLQYQKQNIQSRLDESK